MAHRSVFFLAMLLVATTSVANCLIINGTQILELRILGRVECALPGPPLPANNTAIAGVNVIFSCDGGVTTITTALSDINGFYEVVYNTVDTLAFDPAQCATIVRLPLARCAVYPPTGILRSTLSLVSIVQGLLGAVGLLAAGPLVPVK